MIRIHHPKRSSAGFSLLEVLIAVVVLATGLLSLAALQGSLARNSADAKARSRVSAMLSAQMDELRAGPVANFVDATFDTATGDCSAPPDDFATAACEAATEAGIGGLEVTKDVTTFGSNAAGTTFVQGAAPAHVSGAVFRTVELTAEWTDVAGRTRDVRLRTAVSDLSLQANNPIVDDETANYVPPRAVVRQATSGNTGVVQPGMIPIAMGNGQSTAASNPTPELVGKNNNQQLVGTKFDVMTYTPEGALSVINSRVETEVVKCTCQYGAGGDDLGEVWADSAWPAVWTGTKYAVYAPDDDTLDAPGQQYVSGPKDGVVQSGRCRECCRDRHDDPTDSINAKYDREDTSGAYQKYNYSGTSLVPVTDTDAGTYVESCRMIRVNGLWRTAADMYSRQFGLLETESASGVQAKNGLPTTAATTNYTAFVKDYLKQYDGSVATAPSGAQAMYDDTPRNLNVPTTVSVAGPSTSDYRYMHARGLYVDYLEKQARETLADALAERRKNGQCAVGSSGLADCVLPYLPFLTVNLTEISDWRAVDDDIITVNTANLLATNPTQPSGGRTYATKVGTTENEAKVRKSNSGVAASTAIPGATDSGDAGTVLDTQHFTVGSGNGNPSTGDQFSVALTGGGANPYVFYTLSSDTGECVKPNTGNHKCTTNSTLPIGGTIKLEHYWMEENIPTAAATALNGKQCTYNGSAITIATNGQNANIDVPSYRNYYVSAASIAGSPGTIGAPAFDGTKNETTTITFASIPKDGVASITLLEQAGSPIKAELVSCTARKQGNNYYFEAAVWTKSWE